MLVDHSAIMLFDDPYWMRLIGRLAFPLFAYMIVYNYLHHTRSKERYIINLFIIALLSQLPYVLSGVDESAPYNIIFLLAVALLQIYTIENPKVTLFNTWSNKEITLHVIYMLTPVIYILAYYSEYSLAGYALILSMYFMLKYQDKTIIAISFNVLMILTLMINMSWSFWGMIPIFVFLINCERFDQLIKYRKSYKYLFYAFYPLHLVALTIISSLL